MKMSEDSIKAVIKALSVNPILRYAHEIDEYNLPTLELRVPLAYEAIKNTNHRKVLVLAGIYHVSRTKGKPEDIELEFESQDMRYSFNRFRNVLIDSSRWKFSAESVDDSPYMTFSQICGLIEALLLLCKEPKPTYDGSMRSGIDSLDYKYMSLSIKDGSAFRQLDMVFRGNLLKNEKRIRALLT